MGVRLGMRLGMRLGIRIFSLYEAWELTKLAAKMLAKVYHTCAVYHYAEGIFWYDEVY